MPTCHTPRRYDSTCAERDQLRKDLKSTTKDFNRTKIAKGKAEQAVRHPPYAHMNNSGRPSMSMGHPSGIY
eukprot:COSAG05_NODE_610_length_8361_cov_211.582789_3_plen_71_part_00